MADFEQRVKDRIAELEAEDRARDSIPAPPIDAPAEIHFMSAKISSDRTRALLPELRATIEEFQKVDLTATLRRKTAGDQVILAIQALRLKPSLTDADRARLVELEAKWARLR